MAYIEFNARGFGDATYPTRADAVAAFCRPAYVGGAEKEITWIDEDRFSSRGEIYTVRDGLNPSAAIRAARNAMPARQDAATPAQMRYIAALARTAPESTVRAIMGGKSAASMTKAEASSVIVRLQDIATK